MAIARGAPERARRLAEEAIEITRRPDGVAEPDAFVHLAEVYLAEGGLEAAAASLLWHALVRGLPEAAP